MFDYSNNVWNTQVINFPAESVNLEKNYKH